MPEFDLERLHAAWREAVFALYLAEEKIEPEVVENMRGWPHSGFSVDQSVLLPAGDRAGIERLVQYMTRCPFSLSRLVKVSKTGQVVYKAEKDACRAFSRPAEATVMACRAEAEFSDTRRRWSSWPSSRNTFRRRARTSDPLLRLVLEQGPRHAPQGGRSSGGRGLSRFLSQQKWDCRRSRAIRGAASVAPFLRSLIAASKT